MLAVFSNTVVTPPDELVAAGCRTPSPKTKASELVERFSQKFPSGLCVCVGDLAHLCHTHENQALLQPRSFAMKDEIMCLFVGALDNLASLRQQYGLSKNVNEAVLLVEAYKALRDRAPYPASHVVGHLSGHFAFVVFDRTTNAVFIAADQYGKTSLFWGITSDGYLAFSDDAELLKGSCGKSLAAFPPGCFFLTAGELRSYEHPKNKVTAIPATEEEMWGATFKVERAPVLYTGEINIM
ncbi:hypothetical protein AMTRI_Chr01g137580 [Amborella trichopoda]|uniref:DUF3700 domain-containing protein n=1 Tax=Amborella trichopoda TaxID=13333 RepID=W1PQM7_AMBTC|nr:stem-specific protein TSJT1 [Amborella trichopoda]XP_011625682.1 stem-specific protein TSJT1 [Amborella trichopoda]ERN12332.1 hypothetical protein AMTR_s00025p00066790 [Amborella trichopoda]|eukprot:XP_006850751.1 stem-specific protein TSJT1 [Amborella trichopoda]